MKNVNVRKDELLAALRANRNKHIVEYLSAMDVYRKDVVESLETLLEKAKIEARKEKPNFVTSVNLAAPMSYESAYDTAIKMLTMSTDDVINLSEQEFSQYVEDQWSWKGMFAAVTGSYNSKLA